MADSEKQKTTKFKAPKLEGANQKQQDFFAEEFDSLPDYAKFAITRNKVKFRINDLKTKKDLTTNVEKNTVNVAKADVLFTKTIFGQKKFWAGAIFSYGLLAANYRIDKKTHAQLIEAVTPRMFRGYIKKMHAKMAHKGVKPYQFHNDQTMMADILYSLWTDIKLGKVDEESLSEDDFKQRMYLRYTQKAKQQYQRYMAGEQPAEEKKGTKDKKDKATPKVKEETTSKDSALKFSPPTLEGATKKQQTFFEQEFEKLPDYAKFAITRNHVSFGLTSTKTNHITKDDSVNFCRSTFSKRDIMLRNRMWVEAIFAYGLTAASPLPKSMQKEAFEAFAPRVARAKTKLEKVMPLEPEESTLPKYIWDTKTPIAKVIADVLRDVRTMNADPYSTTENTKHSIYRHVVNNAKREYERFVANHSEKQKIDAAIRDADEKRQRDAQQKEKDSDKKIKPYPFGSIPLPRKNVNQLARNEVKAICQAIDCRDEQQQQLGDMLFTGPVGDLVAALVGGIQGNITKQLNAITSDEQVAERCMQLRTQLWTILHTDAVTSMDKVLGDRISQLQDELGKLPEANDLIKDQDLVSKHPDGINAEQNLARLNSAIDSSPIPKKGADELKGLIADYQYNLEILQSRQQALENLQNTLMNSPIILSALIGRNDLIEEARGLSGDENWAAAFIQDFILLLIDPSYVPDPIHDIDDDRVNEEGLDATIASGAAVADAGIVLTSGTDSDSLSPDDGSSNVKSANEPAPNQEELEDEAFREVEALLISEADLMVLRNLEEGRTQFKCDLGSLKNNIFPIRFTFTDEQGHEEVTPYRDYARCFTEKGLDPPDLGKVVDLKIAVQSRILNSEGIEPLRAVRTSGERSVLINHAIPLNAHRPDARSIRVNSSSGTQSLQIKATDRDERTEITVSIPLGLRSRDENRFTKEEGNWVQHRGDKPEEVSETADRVKHVMEYIEEHGNNRRWVTKREILDDLKDYVEEQGKDWEYGETIPVEGFDQAQVIHEVRRDDGELLQQIELGTVNLERTGGANPSWRAKFNIQMKDYTQPNPSNMHFKGVTFNLHTNDENLALARINEALSIGTLISRSMEGTEGYITQIRNYAHTHPNIMWTTDGGGRNCRIGTKRFEEFKDDSPRYEDDFRIRMIASQQRRDSTTVRLVVQRANREALRSGVQARPETFGFNLNNRRTPLSLNLELPTTDREAIRRFINQLNLDVTYDISEAYASIAISEDSEDKRKTVRGYDPQTVVNHFFGGIIKRLQADFRVTNLEEVLNNPAEGTVESQLLHYQRSRGNGRSNHKNNDRHGPHHRVDPRQQHAANRVHPFDGILDPQIKRHALNRHL